MSDTLRPIVPGGAVRAHEGASIVGPRNRPREQQSRDLLIPPSTDHGTVPNLRWSFADSHNRLEEGGWARETTIRELPVSTTMAGVNMRLKRGAYREMHWHKEGEWAYMLAGRARITAVDVGGRTFQDDVAEGDGWYFPAGIPHSIQGLDSDVDEGGCEFLLVFDDGAFSENSTFLITDWLAHTPKPLVAKNFGVSEEALARLPKHERYIFQGNVPGPLDADCTRGAGPVPNTFTHRLMRQEPKAMPGGSVRILDSMNFPPSTTIAAALVEVEPGAIRELHWHPNAAEWQYYLEGQARMTVFASGGAARTFDFQAGDVGYVPFAMGHYVENTGSTNLRFLEMFRSDRYADLSLNQWMKLTPHEIVRATLEIDEAVLTGLPEAERPVTLGRA